MIHSMSGGVINDAGSYTFVKVLFDGDTVSYWYICDTEVDEGDRVKAPRGASGLPDTGTVVRVERGVNGQVTPVPLKRAKRVIAVLDRGE